MHERHGHRDDGRPRRCREQAIPSLQHPRCVYQVLKRHFSRYTPEMVERACGVPQDFSERGRSLLLGLRPGRTAAICYALGWTQHSEGAQMIRTAAILQLLLGNIGRPGGGILALRGHASIRDRLTFRRCTTCCPVTCRCRRSRRIRTTRASYIEERTAATGCGPTSTNTSSACSRPSTATRQRRRTSSASGWLPRMTGDHSHIGVLARHGRRQDRRAVRDGRQPRGRRRRTRASSAARWPS